MFMTQVVKKDDGTNWAVPIRYEEEIGRLLSESKANRLIDVPGDSVKLDDNDDVAERELALRIVFDGGYDGSILYLCDNRFAVNYRESQAVKGSIEPYQALITSVKGLMTANGADESALNAPGNVGYGTVMSYLGGAESDSDEAIFMKAVCTGESWAVSLWHGETNVKLPGDRAGRSVSDGEFLVLTESETEVKADQIAENNANELLSGLDPVAVHYFDRDRYVCDQKSSENGGVAGLIACDRVVQPVTLDIEGLDFNVFRVA